MKTVYRWPLSEGKKLDVRITRRKGNRHLRLRVDTWNQVVLSAPWQCSDQVALDFLNTHRDWLVARLQETPALQSLRSWLEQEPYLSASGDRFTVRLVQSSGLRSNYRFEKGGADLLLCISDLDSEEVLRQLIRRFAKDVLYCRLAYYAKSLNIQPVPSCSVRDQVGRWGSCSSSGSISLNWRLVLLPPHLQDSVILHELAHLTEMNHSARFWALLDEYDPDRKRNQVELDQIGATIMRVGR